MDKQIIEVELSQIKLNPFQPRKHFSRDELEELAQSIQTVGLIQPPTVVPIEGEDGRFELVSGERRYRAAEMAGLKIIPVIVSSADRHYSAEASLVENIQRVDLNPLEIARALRRMIIEFDFQQDELADRVGKKRSTVANYLRLLGLPREIQESLAEGQISMGHAKAILSLEGFELQLSLHEQVIADDLTVRETEEAAQNVEKTAKRRLDKMVSTRDVYLEDLQDRIQQKFGTKVSIMGSGKRGKISIDYYSLDDLDRILDLLGVQERT
jgi:ParB family chromosome partitioning protein